MSSDSIGDWTEDELASLSREELVERVVMLQRSYASMYNTVTLYRRQLATAQDMTIRSSQVADLARKMNAADLDQIARVATEDIPRLFEATYGALFLHDEEAGLLALKRRHPAGDRQQRDLDLKHDADVMSVHALAKNADPVAIDSPAEYEAHVGTRLRPVPAEAPLEEGGLLCPLLIGRATDTPQRIGILLLGGKEGGFARNDVEIARMLCEMLATDVHIAQLLARMAQLAETDGLTGLCNHRHFQQELDRAVATASRYKTPLSLLMIDIDHFKRFNDQYGHQAGDRVLAGVAQNLRNGVRDKVDLVARYGGEEFGVILSHTPLAGARIAAERLRATVESSCLTFAGEPRCVTISVGVAEFAPAMEKSHLIDAADQALYRAKASGRNRICLFGEE